MHHACSFCSIWDKGIKIVITNNSLNTKMPKPVSQEDLDFAHAEDDRYLHELNQWRKEGLKKALEEEYKRRQQDREAAKKEGLRRWLEFERERQERNEYWQKIQDQITEEYTDGALKEQEFYINIYKRIKDNLSKKADLKSQSYEPRKTIRLKLNRHAEIDVMSNEAAAFPLAHVCVLITTQHSEFINFLIVRLIRKCFYILPRYFAPENGQSIEDYKKFIGYRSNENDESYIERMCAYVAFYCAIAQTDSIIPSTNITAYEMHRAFGDTAFNLFAVIYDSYIANPPPEVQMLSVTSPSAMSRLKTLLEEASERGGKFNIPEGKFPS
ncbi:8617_t:CDS:2 [Diversispora eburnea]|uniref:mRNA export factor GLE1 n=1 Tax=Diversispora eburnea TaxID=1213867 RepID=A0A9N9APL0_9GLOM|nr:8617_t:CDS:2 [Diversispora eburnea]